MKILFIHQYFRTPQEGGGIRSYHMSKALIEAGHEVEMISAHNFRNYLFKNIEGIKVHYLPVYYNNKLGFLGRGYSFLKFLILSTFYALKVKSPQICYASSSPLTVGIIAILVKKFRNIPFIFEVMDLWPEAPIQMGFIKNPLLKKILFWLERKIYKESKMVVTASPGMERGVKISYPKADVITIPNLSDCGFFKPSPKKDLLIEKYKVNNKFVCCYTGAIGLSNCLDSIINIAVFLQKIKPTVHFLIAGDGAFLSEIIYRVQQEHLKNISILGYLSKQEISEVYNISDLNLITFNKQPILETNSPNKFFDGIAAGLPTAININGWIRELVEEHECGSHFNSEEAETFLKLIERLENKETWTRYSENARRLAELNFNKDKLINSYLSLFN